MKKSRKKNPTTKKYYVVDQEQRGLWYQVANFYGKEKAKQYAQYLADTTGKRVRVAHAFPSGHNYPVAGK